MQFMLVNIKKWDQMHVILQQMADQLGQVLQTIEQYGVASRDDVDLNEMYRLIRKARKLTNALPECE